jgi:formylglycine-generating enzyme required for sulfatase activity
VVAGRCAPPRSRPEDPRVGLDDHPATGVDWSDASVFCAFAGGRLPSEAEWERAARGSDARRFPWGRNFDPRLANHGNGRLEGDASDGFESAAPVGSFPLGASPYGVLDLAGNAAEWTADAYVERGYDGLPRVDPRRDERSGYRVVRGGSWRLPPHMLRVSHRNPMPESARFADIGFRCAYDP